MGYTHRFAHYFEPTQVTLAASADLGPDFDVSFDLTYARWSEAVSTNHNAQGAGIWGDTWTPAAGARFKATNAFSLSAGYRFQKSPLDNFGGPTNLLDNDRHVVAMGGEAHLGRLFSDESLDASLSVGLEHILLVERTETKDYRRFASDRAWQENPGYPSYRHDGHVLATMIGVEARW
jgi:hypothetical protein